MHGMPGSSGINDLTYGLQTVHLVSGSVAAWHNFVLVCLSWFDVRIRPLVCQPVQPLVLMGRAKYSWNKLTHSYDAAALHGNVSSRSQNESWPISNNPQSRTEAGLEKSVRRILFVYDLGPIFMSICRNCFPQFKLHLPQEIARPHKACFKLTVAPYDSSPHCNPGFSRAKFGQIWQNYAVVFSTWTPCISAFF